MAIRCVWPLCRSMMPFSSMATTVPEATRLPVLTSFTRPEDMRINARISVEGPKTPRTDTDLFFSAPFWVAAAFTVVFDMSFGQGRALTPELEWLHASAYQTDLGNETHVYVCRRGVQIPAQRTRWIGRGFTDWLWAETHSYKGNQRSDHRIADFTPPRQPNFSQKPVLPHSTTRRQLSYPVSSG